MMGLYQSALVASLPWIIDRSGLSAGFWSLALAVGMVPVVPGAILWGQRADHYGSGGVLRTCCGLVIAGYGVLVAALVLMPAAPVLATLALASRLLHGAGAGGVFPAAQRRVLGGHAPSSWSLQLARLQAALQVGRVAGPALMALMALVSVPLGLALVGVLGLALVGRDLAGVDDNDGLHPPVGQHPPSWGADRYLYGLAFVLTLWVGMLQFVLGPYLQQLLAVDAATATGLTGTALIVAALAGFLVGPLVHRWLGNREWTLTLLWFALLLSGGALLALARGYGSVLAGVALVAAAAAVLTPWYGSRLRQRWPDRRGLMAGRLASLHTCGYALGTLLGGAALQWWPERALMVFPALAPLLLALTLAACRT